MSLDTRLDAAADALREAIDPEAPALDHVRARVRRRRAGRAAIVAALIVGGAVLVLHESDTIRSDSSRPGSTSSPAETPTTSGHLTQDAERSFKVVGSRGTILRVKVTHSVYDAGGGLTNYDLAWADGSTLLIAQEDRCVGANNIVIGTPTNGPTTNAFAVVPSWLDDTAGLMQDGHVLQTERFSIKGFSDIIVATDVVQGQRVELTGIDRSAVDTKLNGCVPGSPGK